MVQFKRRRSLAAKGFTATPLRSYPSTRSLMRITLTEPPPAYSRTAEVYGSFFWSKACKAIKNRADAVLLAHLRAGHTPFLIEYTNFLNSSVDPSCPLCKEEPRIIKHWLWKRRKRDATSPSPPRGPYYRLHQRHETTSLEFHSAEELLTSITSMLTEIN